MSDIDTTTAPDTTGTATGAEAGRAGQAKQMLGQAGQTLKQEAQSFASAAQERARLEAQRRTETASRTLGDFAKAVRRAGDELSQADQSPAARLVAQAADGLEGMATNLAGKRPEELLNAVRDFGRRNPAAFIGGAVLIGLALGRFVRASETTTTTAIGGEDLGAPAYPLAEPATYATGAEAIGDEALGLDAGDGLESATDQGGNLAAPLADDLGDLEPSDVEDSTSVLGVDDGTSGEGVADTTGRGR